MAGRPRALTFAAAGAAVVVLALTLPSARAQDVPASERSVARVAIKVAEPFVLDERDPPRGFSIDVWDEVADRSGLTTEWVWVDTVQDQLAAVRDGRADAAIAAISMTQEREEEVDFSTPIYNSGLQLAVREDDGVSTQSVVDSLLSAPVLRLLGALVIGVGIMGVLIWLLERGRSEDFAREPKGLWDGVWWALVTMMTVGYGDHVPRSKAGRAASMLWMVLGVLFVANLTAVVTASITVSEIKGELSALTDLSSGRVGAVRGTTSESYLVELGYQPRLYDDARSALTGLSDEQVDGVVYDAPILRYLTSTERSDIVLVGPVTRQEYYGIAVGNDSPLLEPIDAALLAVVEDGTYEALDRRWFGTEGE